MSEDDTIAVPSKDRPRCSTSSDFLKACLSVALLVLAAVGLYVGYEKVNNCSSGNSSCGYKKAIVSSDGTPCASIAVKVLQSGGTAADAGIAAMFCSGVVNPHSMGIGGGFLLTYYSKKDGRAYSLISRETAPAAASRNMFKGNASLAVEGGLSVAIPGEVKGYRALYERFGGGVPWGDLIQPSIEIASNGFPVHFHMASTLQITRENILKSSSLRSILVDNTTGDVLKEGDIVRLPQLAETLKILQHEPDALYTGSLAAILAEDIEASGGIITQQDLANYTVRWTDALKIHLNNSDTSLYSIPPPGSGAVLSFILSALDNFNFSSKSLETEEKALTYHLIVETFKHAYGLRTHMGDDAYEQIHDLINNMTSPEIAKSVSEQIKSNFTSQDPKFYNSFTAPPDDHGTSHVSLISSDGDALSATSTINTRFGAKLASPRTGIILNNEMDDFSSPNIVNFYGVPPSPANFIQPGKRPLSSMTPCIFVSGNGSPVLVSGGAGGTRITTSIALVAINNLWFKMNIRESAQAKRIHHQLIPMEFFVEEGFDRDVIEGLQAIGHKKGEGFKPSVITAVAMDQFGMFKGYPDPRKYGQVDGY